MQTIKMIFKKVAKYLRQSAAANAKAKEDAIKAASKLPSPGLFAELTTWKQY